mmetsp:Transcript_100196/g.321320  ORF Transcript_100196/g.321320 Transcript_100196/m.321320 type:complete len:347 (-) Transcript_100196:55-1095(-)
MSLEQAKAKFEAAQSEGQWHEGQRMVQEALRLASAELAAARRKQDTKNKLLALELVVNANMFLGDAFAANLAANDELAMIRRAGEKPAEAAALQLLADVQASRGDSVGAIDSLRHAVVLATECDDKRLLARASRSLAIALLSTGKRNDALAPAQDALKLYEEVGDQDGEASARRTVNTVFVEKGQLDKAPNRPQALEALKDLSDAVTERDSSRWHAAMEELNKTCAYTQKDVDNIVQAALEKNRPSAFTFLEEQGIVAKGAGLPQTHIKEVGKQMHYLNFRLNGLGYGPRFRCANSYKKQVGEDLNTLAAVSCLQVSEEAEDWEAELQFHPGVLDSMLQSGNAYYV